jgi:hypothetical protein
MINREKLARRLLARRSRGDTLRVLVLLAVAFGGGAAIGALGASEGQNFAWNLFAEGATAFGTVLLAAYTASLARSTSREVAVTAADLRGRDRPAVVAVVEALTTAVLEPLWGEHVPVLNIRLLNVGLGPALNLRLRVTYPESDGAGTETVAVLPVGDDQLRSVPVQEIVPPEGGFLAERFVLAGSFESRGSDIPEDIVVLADEGLRDLQRAAEQRAAVKANPYLSIGGQLEARHESVDYQASIGNTARGTAYDVLVVFVDADGTPWGEPMRFQELGPNRGETAIVTLPLTHPALSFRISWRDGEGEHIEERPEVLQPLPP